MLPLGTQTHPLEAGAASALFRTGSSVRVFLSPADEAECAALAQQLSADGSFWSVREQGADSPGLSLVCAMRKDRYRAFVEDAGGRYYGQALCSSLLGAGWTEDAGAEGQVEQAAAAAAAASAAAARVSRDETAAEDLVASLRDVPNQLASDLAQMDSDVQQTLTDLTATKSDAANGQGEGCYNVSTVTYDAENKVAYDATNAVRYDATQHVAATITGARKGLAELQELSATLAAEGGRAPSDTDAVEARVREAINAAIGQANNRIDQANDAAKTAYRIARSLATGACVDHGPGVFTPVPHIG